MRRLEAKTKLQAGKMFQTEVISVQRNEPVAKVVELMKSHGYSQLPVFEGKHSVGSISEKTILRQILDGKDLAQISHIATGKSWRKRFRSWVRMRL